MTVMLNFSQRLVKKKDVMFWPSVYTPLSGVPAADPQIKESALVCSLFNDNFFFFKVPVIKEQEVSGAGMNWDQHQQLYHPVH